MTKAASHRHQLVVQLVDYRSLLVSDFVLSRECMPCNIGSHASFLCSFLGARLVHCCTPQRTVNLQIATDIIRWCVAASAHDHITNKTPARIPARLHFQLLIHAADPLTDRLHQLCADDLP